VHAYGSHAVRLAAAKELYGPQQVFTATPLRDRGLLEALAESARDAPR